MEKRDYLQKQIDQLGKMLGKLLSELIRLKSQGQTEDGIQTTYQVLQNELDISMADLHDIKASEFINILLKDKKLSHDNINKLADILYLLAESTPDVQQTRGLYQKSLTLYEYLEQTESIYSLERHTRINKISDML